MDGLTELLATVDAALDAWEDSPHAWSPGDPLYPRPECTDACYRLLDSCTDACDGLDWCEHDCEHVGHRDMVELIDIDQEYLGVPLAKMIWCTPCGVGWAVDHVAPCWACGSTETYTDLADTAKAIVHTLTTWQRAWLDELYTGTGLPRLDPAATAAPRRPPSERFYLDRLVRGQ
jgi:hypothetical protein